MRRNGGIIGPLQEPSGFKPEEVKVFDNHDRHIRGSDSWPDVPAVTGISQTAPNNGSTNVLQNDVTTFTVTGTGHEGGAVTYGWNLNLSGSGMNEGAFDSVTGTFTMGTDNTGTFTIETEFTADPYFVTAAFPKTFTIEIKKTVDSVLLTSSTYSIVNFTIPSTFEGFKEAALDEGAGNDGTLPNSPYMQFKMQNVGSAGSSAGAIRFFYPNFLEFTSSAGIQLCGGYGGSGSTERYQAESTNSTAGSTGEMIFTVRGVPSMSVWYQFNGNDNASSQARLYTSAAGGGSWSQEATSNSTTSVTGALYGLHDGDRIKFEFYNDGGGFSDGRGEITGLYGYAYSSSVYGSGVATMSTNNSPGVADVYKISVNNASTYNYASVFNGSGYSDLIAVDPDYSTEGVQYARVQIAMYGKCKAREGAGADGRLCWTQVSADQATINDTSKTANISSNTPFNVTEGQTTGQLQITNTGQSTPGTLFYTCTGTGVTNADFSTFQTSGSLTMNTQFGTQQFGTVTIDPIAEGGTAENESFQVQIRKSNTSGTILHTTNSITITDTTPTTKNLILSWVEHRLGSYIGNLRVYLVDAATGGQNFMTSALYNSSGATGSSWQIAQTSTYADTAGQSRRYLFYYVSGNSWAGDWAIDNVNVTKDGVQQWFDGFESTPTDWYTGPSGQSNSTTVAQAWNDKIVLNGSVAYYTGRWYRHTGSTGSSGTGPSSAYSGSYYAYAEVTGSTWPRRFYLWTPAFTV